jgi:chitodextrinase
MKLSSHSVVATRAAVFVLLLGAALPLAAQTAIGGADTIPPTVPTGLVGTAVSAKKIGLSWNPSTDDVGVIGYLVYDADTGSTIATTTTTSFTHSGLVPGTTHNYRVSAFDAVPNHSPWTDPPVSVTTPVPDSDAPSVPTGLVGTAVSASQIGLSWNPSTDNVGVTGYYVYNADTGGTVKIVNTNSFSHTGLTAGTTYNYRVSSFDAAGNNSPWTDPPVSVTTPVPDSAAPSVPTGLTGKAVSQARIRLSWTASTDNVGVTGYLVYDADTGSTIATTTTTSFTHSGLVAGTTYNYRVSAFDAVPNHSPWTDPPVSVTTLPPDTTAPSTPTEILASAVSSSQINLSWAGSTDNVQVTRYIVRRDGVKIATPVSTSYADTGLSAATTYSYTVAARDAAGNISPNSASVSVTTASAADTMPPSTPTGLTGAAAGSTGANLSWSASTDDVGVTAYIVLRNGIQVATPAATSYTDTGLSAGATYSYTVAARDAGGNISPNSASVSVTTASAADTTPPSTPIGLTAAAAGSSGANLSWSASTDNVGVTGYIVRRNGVQIATPAATSYADTGLSLGTYSYTVAARDATGNISPNSASASITIADTTSPTTPTGLTGAAAGSSGANLSWGASTDNVGVTGYIVRRNGIQVAAPAATSYADAGLSAATTYNYTVAARDAAGNISPISASVSVTTGSTPPPPPSNSASLAWDSVTGSNLSGYRLYFGTAPGTYLQSDGQGTSVGNVTTYTMTGLASGSRYYFAVTAFDTLGIESDYSNEIFQDIP